MNEVLLDTHVFVWYVNGNEINRRTQKIIDSAIQAGCIYLADISLWEISMLVLKQRIILAMPCMEWINRGIEQLRLQILPITPNIAVESCNLPGNFHGDPADRLIVATARAHGMVLATRDSTILEFGKTKVLSVVKA
ncbi:MAG TPA: type II toxin-antitoxin system VapC family toxin [Gammaproteobacteria bacterium]|nr:type II toxin-antitoxin system VapC family toxin [Gammaproteobacteria bacterium]